MSCVEAESNDIRLQETQFVSTVQSMLQGEGLTSIREHVPSCGTSSQVPQEVDISSQAKQQQILQISPSQFVQLLSSSSDNGSTYIRCQPASTINGENAGGGEDAGGISVLGSIPAGYQIVSLHQSSNSGISSHSDTSHSCSLEHLGKPNDPNKEQNVVVIRHDSNDRAEESHSVHDVQNKEHSQFTSIVDIHNLNLSKEGQQCNWEPTVTVQISENDTLSLQKFYFQKTLCRVCLLEKESTTSIFENLTVDEKGMIENSKGPKAVRYNIIPALKTLLGVEVKVGDGLPTQICMDCLDRIIEFSAFRRRIAIGQEKLRGIISQVSSSNNPTLLISIGEPDFRKTDMFKHPDWIIQAKSMLATSSFCHLVQRLIPDRVWDKIFSTMSDMMGAKSSKLRLLEKFVLPGQYALGWFCGDCNLTIQGGCVDRFEAHCSSVHGINKHDIHLPCDICGNAYSIVDATGLSQSYTDHWLQHFYFYECGECSKRFPSHKSLWGHVKASHRSATNANSCDSCDRYFVSKSALEAHKRTHLDKNERLPFLNFCELCGKGLTGNLQTHMDSVHFDKRPFKCDICEKSFSRREILTSHRALVHLNIRKFKCDTCGKSFKSSASKKIHILRHKGEKPHSCLFPDCGQSFYSAKALRSHSLKHQEVGAFKCTECGKCFKRKRYLDEHSTLHSGIKPYECSHCGKQIRMKSNYYKHLKIHERKQPETENQQIQTVTVEKESLL